MHLNYGLKALFQLFVPILLMTFSSYLFLFMEKILLGRFATEAMEAAVNAAYVCNILQNSCVGIAMMAQVFVGRNVGSGKLKLIGPTTWQFIWFSIGSMFFIVPGSLFIGHYYFQGTAIEAIVWPYYCFIVGISFLYPLYTTLSCFFISQGKTKLVFFSTICSQGVKLLLAYLFIFGWEGWMSAWGLLGGAISTLVAQGGLCLLLLGVFMNSKNAAIFQSRNWHFQPKLCWELIQPGFFRALCRILTITSWAMIAHLMTSKSGDYLLVLSIGGTLFMFLPFMGDAIGQALTTLYSQIIGSENLQLLDRCIRSGNILALSIIAILSPASVPH